MLQRLLLTVLLATTAWALPARAQILIGQTAGHTGAVAATVKEATAGARLLFDAINALGLTDAYREGAVSPPFSVMLIC